MSDQERNEPQPEESSDSHGQEGAGPEPARERFWQGVSVPDLVKQRIDVIKAQQSRGRKLLMALRKFYAILPIAAFIYFSLTNPTFQNTVLAILQFAVQLLFAIFYAIIQFVAIFWFMARSKVEKVRPTDPKSITFDDYWGQPNLKALVRQWLGLLADRREFVQMGGRYINGLLLYGPPGTGKTMLAKAMAGEAGVAFISIEGSGFRAMFVGVDVLKMIWFIRKARKYARRYGACIAYIDEIDAVGQSRGGVQGDNSTFAGGGMFGGGTGALTRLLYEMDGVDQRSLKERIVAKLYQLRGKKPPARNWHVLFMGSTNRPDVLDPALTRPGRFDQMIEVGLPDRSGRRAIVEGYLSTIRHDDSVDVEAIVSNTPGASPAQMMAALTKDTVRIALFEHRNVVTQRDIDRALIHQLAGMENPIEEMDPEQRRSIAVHEAGHAVVVHYVLPEKRIGHLTILARGQTLGFMLPLDEVEQYSYPLRRIVADIMVALGGHAAVRIVYGEEWTGAYSDYRQARDRFRHLYSLGYFGPPTGWISSMADGLGAPAGAPPPEVNRLWQDLEDRTERLLRDHRGELMALTDALLERNELNTGEVLELLGPNGHNGTNGHVGPSGGGGIPPRSEEDGGRSGTLPGNLSARDLIDEPPDDGEPREPGPDNPQDDGGTEPPEEPAR
ncbi:MAG: AAA family ATPase [Spirochaetaceae bacterium]|nr:AAA family ATPase [Spirochaetaceae bacterium]